MPVLPARYAYLEKAPDPPRMVVEALKELGTVEAPGAANNRKILDWADEVAATCGSAYANWAADFYNKDSIPWCGLFMGVIAARSANGRPERFPPSKYLAALAWANWGVSVGVQDISVGDVVMLVRQGGGHVFLAVGTSSDGQRVMGLGGNQGDAVTIAEFPVTHIYAVRRPPYLEKPAGARPVVLAAQGAVEMRMA